MTEPPDEQAIMTEMLAVLADVHAAGGVDTDPGWEALLAGARSVSAIGRKPYFLLVIALSGWLGALEGAAEAAGIDLSEVIARYAAGIPAEESPDPSESTP